MNKVKLTSPFYEEGVSAANNGYEGQNPYHGESRHNLQYAVEWLKGYRDRKAELKEANG